MSFLFPEGASTGDVVVFWILAAMVTFFAVFTITRKNPVTAVMSLVATFFGLAAMYATLSAHFLAVLQVLVYAGAITVLFIFVVMILNREEVTPLSYRPLRVLGVLAGVYLFVKVVDIVAVGMPTVVPATPSDTFGTVAAVGDLLFRDFLYPFEAISILLLVAIVGGVVISRSHQKEVAANVAAAYRKQVHELASHDYPGAPTSRRRKGTTRSAMPTIYYLILSFGLFLIGTTGVLLRRNALIVLMAIELQLNGGNLALIAFSRQLGDLKGHVFAFLIIALAAAEAAVGLAILVGLFRGRQTVNLDEITLMKR